ncbi:MAG: NAD(P)-dependent alcohol dehydrogenase [Candidatus Brocadiae bacterium]|nr:NAD(P)-dependent alcohol dehydrogenase [Candidatus Brocadiia bacterium]
MKAVYLEEVGKFALREIPVPRPGPRDVLVAARSVGVCGSDIHYFEHGRIGDFVVEKPMILGHECAGEVVEVGPEVRMLAVGDRVALEPGIPCRHCKNCLSGRYNLCADVVFMATPPYDGAFCEYVLSPEDFAYKLPETVSYEAGATVEPLAVGLHAAVLVGLQPGERVVVLGAGPIGLLAVAVARAFGATEVTAVDLIPMRLDFARRMGASRTVNAREEDAGETLKDSADVVLDCVAVAKTLTQAFEIIRPGGRVAWVGMAAEVAEVPFQKFQAKEAIVTGVFRYANRFRTAVNLLASGRIDSEPLITHRFRFPQVEEAITFAAQNRERALKTMVNFG